MKGITKVLVSGFALALAFSSNGLSNLVSADGGSGDTKVAPVLSFDFTQAELDAASGDGFAPSVGDSKYTLKFRDHWQKTGHVLDHYSFVEGGGIDFRQSTATWDNSERMLLAMDKDGDIYHDINKDFTMSFDLICEQKGSDDWATVVGTGCNASNYLGIFSGKCTQARLACKGLYWEATEFSQKGYNSNSGLQETGWVDNEYNHIVISVNPTNKRLKAWCNNVLTVDVEIAENYSVKDANCTFSIGGAWNGGGAYYSSGAIKNLDFYDFALSNKKLEYEFINKGYVTVNDTAEQKVVEPMAKYEFNDPENPGKDSQGKYDLEVIGTATGATVADGKLSLDGNAGLASPFTNDIADAIAGNDFTMIYKGQAKSAGGFAFSALSGFWGAGQGVAISTNSNVYRAACSDSTGFLTGDKQSNDWGEIIANDFNAHTIAITKDESAVKFYVDNELKQTYEIATMNLKSDYLRFTIGGSDWNSFNYKIQEDVEEFRVYNFALTNDQIKEVAGAGDIYESQYSTVESVPMQNWTTKIVVPSDATDEEILTAYAPAPHVIDVNMSTGKTAKATVTWNKVIRGVVLKLQGTLSGVQNDNNVKAYAIIGTKDNCKTIQPVAKYNFASKDAVLVDETGRFPLELNIKTKATQDDDGNTIYVPLEGVEPTVENGAVVFDGKYSLINRDLGKYLGTTGTISYDIELSGTNDDWATPVGFGQNGWDATSFAKFQFSGGSDLLRLAIGDKNDQGKSTINDMTGNGYWGAEIASLGTTKHNVTLVLNDEEHVKVYVDNECKFDAAQNGFTLDFTSSTFCIGGVYGFEQFIKNCKISNVSVYDFAATSQMVKVLNTLGSIKTNQYTDTYVSAIGTEPHFEGTDVLSSTVRTENTDAEILAAAKSATVTATLSDDNTKELAVKWVSVDRTNNKLVGKVVTSTADHLQYVCSTDVTVYASIAFETKYTVTVGAAEGGTVTPSATEGYAGDKITLTVTPEEGYVLESLTVNGEAIVAAEDGSYSFTVSGNATVAATFAKAGCGGSVLACSAIATFVSVLGLAFLGLKKKEER